jgi:hypothetical protein
MEGRGNGKERGGKENVCSFEVLDCLREDWEEKCMFSASVVFLSSFFRCLLNLGGNKTVGPLRKDGY